MSQPASRIGLERRRPLVDRRVLHFLRHLGEMTLAMVIGMAALGGAFRGAFAVASAGTLQDVELSALAMAFSMSVPMAAWMRHRGHGWTHTLEMAGAMIVPAALLLVGFRLDAVTGPTVMSVQHAVMLPGMIAVMLFRCSDHCH